MDRQEFLEILLPVAELYGKKLGEAALTEYYKDVEFLNSDDFRYLMKKHRKDPDQGKYFPIAPHLLSQASNEQSVKTQAGIEFDKNPKIDGTISFDVQKETYAQRAERRRRYVGKLVESWKAQSSAEKINGQKNLEDVNSRIQLTVAPNE